MREEINILKKSLESYKSGIDSFNEKFHDFENGLSDIRENQTKFLSNFKENVDVIRELKEELKKEVYDFKLLKSQLHNKLVEKFEEEQLSIV